MTVTTWKAAPVKTAWMAARATTGSRGDWAVTALSVVTATTASMAGDGRNTYSVARATTRSTLPTASTERVNCGAGRDVVRADSTDRLTGCERVFRLASKTEVEPTEHWNVCSARPPGRALNGPGAGAKEYTDQEGFLG
jgi:hypothetical protein